MKKILIVIAAVLTINAALAGPKMTTEIENIRVRPYVTYVKLAGCPKYNKIRLDTEYGKAMYSAALTAATARKQVKVEFTEEDGCQTTESEFNYFDIRY